VIEWLDSGEADRLDPIDLLSAFGRRLRRTGLAVHRVILHFGTLHPEVFNRVLAWAPGEPLEIYEHDHLATVSAGFPESPFREVALSGRKTVVRAGDAKCSNALCEGASRGRRLNELVVVPLCAFDSVPVIVSFGTRRAVPFSADDHSLIDTAQLALSAILRRQTC
jgi:adenylate cyclase